MECVICKNGSTYEGNTTVTLENGGTVLVIKDVPAQICSNCGEYYLNDTISEKLLKMAHETKEKGVEVEVMHMKAAS